jgi:hypothetical protein
MRDGGGERITWWRSVRIGEKRVFKRRDVKDFRHKPSLLLFTLPLLRKRLVSQVHGSLFWLLVVIRFSASVCRV